MVGAGWPPPGMRLDMLEEAIEICRALWEGDEVVFRGAHFDIEHARLYTTPGEAIPVVVAAGKPEAAMLAGRAGDGLVTTSPDGELVSVFRESGGEGPTYGQMTVCWNEDEAEARKEAERHRSMVKAYGGTKMTTRQEFEKHCTKLIKGYESQAEEYEALAAMHEKEAGGS